MSRRIIIEATNFATYTILLKLIPMVSCLAKNSRKRASLRAAPLNSAYGRSYKKSQVVEPSTLSGKLD